MILVVDEDVTFLELASKVLNRDRQVFLASDPEQGFQLAQDLGFSVALVDLDLKGDDGLSLIRSLRDHFPDLPVIAISSAFGPRVRDRAISLGAVELLQKPASPDWKSIVERVRKPRRR